MADSRVRIGGDGPLSPDDVARKTFPTTRRGFDPADVRQFLEAVAAELRRLRDRLHDLDRRPADELAPTTLHPEPAASSAPAEPTEPPLVDIATLTSALGAETARVLRTAQEAAVDLRTRAEEGAARALSEAHDEAARIRAQAEGLLAQRTEEADAMAAKLRAEVDNEVNAARARAEVEVEAKIRAAVDRGREMVGEAQAARERMLSDLARRRKAAITQLEQLRAGRERLLEAYRSVRHSLDEITDELSRAESEANLAADAAGRRVHLERMAAESAGDEALLAEASALAEAEDAAASRQADRDWAIVTPPPTPVELAPAEAVPPPAATAAAPEPPAPLPPVILPPAPITLGDVMPVATLPASAVGAEPEPQQAPATDSSVPKDAPGVDQLFARIRADRAEATVKAHETLATAPVASVATEVQADPARAATVATVATVTEERSTEPANGPAPVAAPMPVQPEAGAPATVEPEAEVGGEQPVAEAVSATEDEATPSDKDDEAFLQRRDHLVEPLASSLTKKIKRLLAHEQNVALDRLRTHRGKLTVDAILPEQAAHTAPYVEAVVALLEEADLAGARLAVSIGTVAPLDLELGNADSDGLRTLAEGMATDLLGPLRQRLERSIADGAGDDPTVADDVVRSAYRELKSARIERVVMDRMTGAVTLGMHRALPAGTMVRWLVDDADGACPDCDDNALAGPTALGEPFPTGQLGPPAHPGCRCLLGPTPA